MNWNNSNLIQVLQEGGVAVMPTDTLYGIVGSAFNTTTVERIYKLRGRNEGKPCIVLIGDVSELKKFSVDVSKEQARVIENFPSPTSFVLDCQREEFSYLHRGTKTLAFRLPAPQQLRDLLIKTGPLVAPSANKEGEPPAKNISEAKNYFGNLVNLYVDGGELAGEASRVIKLHSDGSADILRK
ncbi:MAG: L-threonylcarbamoyladenylate synthase [Candidatus Paceibacterota bacterium]